jgi:hypothetical protein
MYDENKNGYAVYFSMFNGLVIRLREPALHKGRLTWLAQDCGETPFKGPGALSYIYDDGLLGESLSRKLSIHASHTRRSTAMCRMQGTMSGMYICQYVDLVMSSTDTLLRACHLFLL